MASASMIALHTSGVRSLRSALTPVVPLRVAPLHVHSLAARRSALSVRADLGLSQDVTPLSGAMAAGYDRLSEIKAFDETKSGVKGLVDAGITKIPGFFIDPTAPLYEPTTNSGLEIPVIDLENIEGDGDRRKAVVEEVRKASETLGLFKVLNHGIPASVLDEVLEGVRRFHEQPAEVKKEYYTREIGKKKAIFNTNFDLYKTPAANWRDTLYMTMAPDPPQPEELPIACREIIIQYSMHVQKLAIRLLELLSEALGLKPSYLNDEMECGKGFAVLGQYYPPCPEPDLTLGTSKHSDPSFLTVLLQDQIGGLQILYEKQWIDVPPQPGCLGVSIGDLLQLISNDKLKSVEHRVLASKVGPRVSVPTFFFTHYSMLSRIYGPIKELLADGSPPVYKQVLLNDFTEHYHSKGLDGRRALDHFKF